MSQPPTMAIAQERHLSIIRLETHLSVNIIISADPSRLKGSIKNST